jgi:hypothetical protein
MPAGTYNLGITELAVQSAQTAPGRLKLLTNLQYPTEYPSWNSFHRIATNGQTIPFDYNTWGAKTHWNRISKELYIWGTRTDLWSWFPERWSFYRYRAVDNRFLHNVMTTEPVKRRIDRAHAYSKQSLDDSRGHWYCDHRPDDLAQYDIARDKWNFIELDPTGISFPIMSSACWHEGLDGLITHEQAGVNSRALFWQYGDDRWRPLATTGHSGYHAHTRYNRVRGDMLILGGNDNPLRVTLIDATGNVTTKADRPETVSGQTLSFSMQDRYLSYDPVSGNYLLMDWQRKILWEYSPDLDEWRLANNWNTGQPYASDWPWIYYGINAAPIEELGVLLMMSSYEPRIYKHVSVF